MSAEQEALHYRLFEDPKVQEILTLIGGLMALEHDIERHTMRRPVGVMLPARLDPGKYEGPGATEVPTQVMGYPITWGDQVGLIYAP